MRRASSTAIALAALILAPAASAAPVDRAAAARGAEWISARPVPAFGGSQADAIVALRAVGTPRARLRARVRRLARVARTYGRRPGPAAKVTLAALAVGADPTRFGRVNYPARITRGLRAGRYGTNAFDHGLAIIALRRAGRPVPARAIATLRAARGRGGWNLALDRTRRDEVDATAIVIRAMRAAGVSRGDPALRAATAWMARQAHRRGGFDSRGGRRAPEANSTAAAIIALATMGRRASGARAALRRLQRRDGGFNWKAGAAGSRYLATTDAVIALSR